MKPPRLDLNPSSADRWTTCTASPQFILDNFEKLPPSGTRFSEEGTSAHEVAAAFLQDREPGVTPTPIDAAMRWHGWNYAEYVTSLRAEQSMLLVEQKMSLWYMAGRNAIVDAVVSNPTSLHIVDYKYGEGIVVHPEGNLQATIYAYAAGAGLGLSDDFPVFIHIYQPRGRNASEPAHVWETTWKDITGIAVWQIQQAAEFILGRPNPMVPLQFAPSEKACQWCPAKGFCEARRASLLDGIEALTVLPPPTPLPLAAVLSDDQIGAVLKHSDAIVKWAKGVEEYALERMKGGYAYPGFKLVLSRGGNRYWTDEKKAAELLLQTHLRREEIVTESVIGPAGAEKLLGKRAFGSALLNLIAKPPGYPQIAAEDDKRDAIGHDALSDFQEVTE